MSDIAKRAKTSVAAVSVTLNGAKSKTLKVSADTRERIMQAAEELGYRRNPMAGALATGRSRVIGLMLPDSSAYAEHDPFYSLVTTGITRCASEHSLNVMLYSATAEDEGGRAAKMIDRLIDGLILVSPPADSPIFAECALQRIPFATILGGQTDGGIAIASDDTAGGALATEHLLGLGHRRIGHLLGRRGVVTTEPRRRAYQLALEAAGVEYNPDLVASGDFTRSGGYAGARQLLTLPSHRRPTAIFAANDLSAHGAIEAAADAGLRVPEDVAVVGYDDTWYATIPRPALTTVSMDVARLGFMAASLLIAHIDGSGAQDASAVLPVSLTVRDSCGSRTKAREPDTE